MSPLVPVSDHPGPPMVLDVIRLDDGDVQLTIGLAGLRRAHVVIPAHEYPTLATGPLLAHLAAALPDPRPDPV